MKVLLLVLGLFSLVSCGVQNSSDQVNEQIMSQNIVGGTLVSEEPFKKYMAGIYNVAEFSLCTATIIDEDVILTAAHCLQGAAENIRVFFGTDIMDDASKQLKVIKIVGYKNHEEYSQGFSDRNDIALVKLQSKIPAGYLPAPILPSASFLNYETIFILAGYGDSSFSTDSAPGVLRYVTKRMYTFPTTKEITFNQKDQRGACAGDSGGPGFALVNNEYYAWGVASRIHHKSSIPICMGFSYYTNILSYLDWIERTKKSFSK